jgi:hypothetical protein
MTDSRQTVTTQLENAGYIRSYMGLYISTKEIPSPEMNTLKETPYLDSI